MRVTSKGQVTIPAAIRRKLGILPNSEVEFVEQGNQIILQKKQGGSRSGMSRGEQLVAHMRGSGTVDMTTDEIIRLMREDED